MPPHVLLRASQITDLSSLTLFKPALTILQLAIEPIEHVVRTLMYVEDRVSARPS